MNKQLLGLALSALLCTGAHATQWVEVGSRADGVAQFLDLDSIERNLGLVELDRVIDYPAQQQTAGGKRFASQLIRTEFDCGSRAMRQVRVEWHAERKGSGTLVDESRVPEDWAIDQFDAFTAPLWQIACESSAR